jgi:hypothetical protein
MTSSSRHSHGQAVLGRDRASTLPPDQSSTRYKDHPSVPASEAEHPVLSVYAASERFVGEWILLRVTGTDEETNLAVGEVVKHSLDRRDISRAVRRLHQQDPAAHLYVFVGGTRRLVGDELRAALAEGAKGPYVNARW